MMTVLSTPADAIKSSSVSAVASRSGLFALGAHGYLGSDFHTWTCESTIWDGSGAASASTPPAAAAENPLRVVFSSIVQNFSKPAAHDEFFSRLHRHGDDLQHIL